MLIEEDVEREQVIERDICPTVPEAAGIRIEHSAQGNRVQLTLAKPATWQSEVI